MTALIIQIEFVEEAGKLYVQFYNSKDDLVAKRELPKGYFSCTIEACLQKFRHN